MVTPTLLAARIQKQYVLPGSRLFTTCSAARPWYTCLRSSCSELAISRMYSVMSAPPSTAGGPRKEKGLWFCSISFTTRLCFQLLISLLKLKVVSDELWKSRMQASILWLHRNTSSSLLFAPQVLTNYFKVAFISFFHKPQSTFITCLVISSTEM